ncbi:MAG: hypothetical protein U0525_05435 [Patescibacteria group bacterium]
MNFKIAPRHWGKYAALALVIAGVAMPASAHAASSPQAPSQQQGSRQCSRYYDTARLKWMEVCTGADVQTYQPRRYYGYQPQQDLPAGGYYGYQPQQDLPAGGYYGYQLQQDVPSGNYVSGQPHEIPDRGTYGDVPRTQHEQCTVYSDGYRDCK